MANDANAGGAAAPSTSLNVDMIIEAARNVKNNPPGVRSCINLPEQQATALVLGAENVIAQQPALLTLEAPINIVGDIHGQFQDLLRLLDFYGMPPHADYLFLGDYIDRGHNGLETMFLLLALKLKYPERIWLLRGNHESPSINRMYGFFDECKRRYSAKLWNHFNELFNHLPMGATISKRVFCVHGGLSPSLLTPQDLASVVRPFEVPDKGLLCDALWSDPDSGVEGWAENDRGVSFTFGEDRVKAFLERNDLDLIVRAHQVVENGYEFFAERRLVTVFSAPAYCGEFNNAGALMHMDEGLQCSFKILKPILNDAEFKEPLRSGASARPPTPPRR